MFAARVNIPVPADAFEDYIRREPIRVGDPIAYWNGLLSESVNGPLARMALDVLSAPGTILCSLCTLTFNFYI